MSTENQETSRQMNDESLFQQIRSLPRVVWILFVGMFIHRFGTFVVPFLTLYLNDQGYSPGRIGSVFAALAVGGIGAMFLGGRLSDLIGRKNTMAISLFGVAISMILMWQSDTYLEFMISAFLSGITGGMYHPASNSLLIDVVPAERRVTAFATVRWGVNIGFACGMAAGGYLADRNFAYLFIGDAVSSAAFAIIALMTLPHGITATREQSRWRPALRHILQNRRFLAFVVANFCAVMAFFHWGSSVAKFITDLGYSKQVFGWIVGMNGLLIALFELGISQIVRKRSHQRIIAIGFFLCGAGVWINLFAFNWQIIALAMLIFTLGEMIALPISGAYVASLAPEKMRGRYSASVGLTWNAGQGIAPWVGLLLYDQYPAALWWSCLGLGIISAALMLIPHRDSEP